MANTFDNIYEGGSKIKVDAVCGCGNVSENAYYEHKYGAFCIYKGHTYICDRCGKEMKLRITKVEQKVTETEVN